MAKITVIYKTKNYEFNVDNANDLLTKAQASLGITNLTVADLGLTQSEPFIADKEINLALTTEFVRGKTYVVRSVTEDKAERKHPANVNGELSFGNTVIL